MPEEPEIETSELQERVHEAHAEHVAHGDAPGWIRSVSLSTAILAVFAAVGALQAGSLVNEAMMSQIKASDAWNEYQASRQKSHLYTVGRDLVLDLSPGAHSGSPKQPTNRRVAEYQKQIDKEDGKTKPLSNKAKELEAESEHKMSHHERFAYEVALMQVAIALGAVSALTKVKSVWLLSMGLGAVGVVLFVYGFVK
ncbi:MAG: DUF4337 domain-containing protein [Fimbriimonadaceae bacterium]